MVLNGDLRLFHLTLTSCNLSKRAHPDQMPHSLASDKGLNCLLFYPKTYGKYGITLYPLHNTIAGIQSKICVSYTTVLYPNNQGTDSTGGSIVPERRLGKWS